MDKDIPIEKLEEMFGMNVSYEKLMEVIDRYVKTTDNRIYRKQPHRQE